ncbi:Ribosomal protein L9/RNase H1, N-terminal [Sesbania bispinosa]|nr:Ribosomal protein L9/RNase H1, N-terminal [Sesbania bispinosa]
MASRGSSGGKTYVVFVGCNPGFYSSWSEFQLHVHGFSGCLYQSFNTREEAESAWLRYWSRVNMNSYRGHPFGWEGRHDRSGQDPSSSMIKQAFTGKQPQCVTNFGYGNDGVIEAQEHANVLAEGPQDMY